MSRAAVAIGAAALLFAAGCGGAKTVTVVRTETQTVTATSASGTSSGDAANASACAGDDMTGAFAVIQGSAGAGQISYRLTLTNASQAPCFVSGLPEMQLLDATGSPVPTNAQLADRGKGTAAKIVVAPGEAVTTEARFSPDVPGPNEQQAGPCEPKAAVLVVTLSGGGVEAPVQPPTSVCEQGTLNFDLPSPAG